MAASWSLLEELVQPDTRQREGRRTGGWHLRQGTTRIAKEQLLGSWDQGPSIHANREDASSAARRELLQEISVVRG